MTEHQLRRGVIRQAYAEDVYPQITPGSVSLVISDGPYTCYDGGEARQRLDPPTPQGVTAMRVQHSEEWRPVPGWDGYEVSNHGRVRSWKKCRARPDEALPRVLAAHPLPRGYLTLRLKDRGRRRSAYVHRLVLEAFVGACPAGQECRHLNGDPEDNHLENLAWGTPAQNGQDRERHGSQVRGEKQHAARVTAEAARAILDHPGSHREAADAHGVSYHLAYCIRTRRTWRHL